MSKGWISVHRQFKDHWLWKEKRVFSKAEAWLDILMAVNHSEQKVVIKNVVYTVKRSESIMSLDSWSKRWNWNKSKVRRFLEVLQSELMIVTKNETQTTRLTVCNYDSYQTNGNADETQMKRKRNTDETQTTPNNNDNNDNNENNENKKELLFETFWNLYDKKTDTKSCKAKFLKLSNKDIEDILKVVKIYVDLTPDKKYRKNPSTWLNNESWKDESLQNKQAVRKFKRPTDNITS